MHLSPFPFWNSTGAVLGLFAMKEGSLKCTKGTPGCNMYLLLRSILLSKIPSGAGGLVTTCFDMVPQEIACLILLGGRDYGHASLAACAWSNYTPCVLCRGWRPVVASSIQLIMLLQIGK